MLPKDPTKEMWDGKRVGKDGAHEYGATESYDLHALGSYISSIVSHKSLVLIDKKPTDFPPLPSGLPVQNAKAFLETLRFTKSPNEIELAQKAADISESGFRAIMRSSRPDINEHVLSAELEWECRRRGAQRLAYPPVVAGGGRANTLHYITNNLPIRDGEMVLVDGGCELHCFSSDVSRTWPVNGRFSPAQKELYNAVLDVQKQCIEVSPFPCRGTSNTLCTAMPEGTLVESDPFPFRSLIDRAHAFFGHPEPP